MADSLVPGIDEELVRALKEPAGSNLRGADAVVEGDVVDAPFRRHAAVTARAEQLADVS